MYSLRPLRHILLCGFFSASGCFANQIGPFPEPPHLGALVESAEIQIPLYVQDSTSNQSHGYQFLLFILPVSSVYADQLSKLVTHQITTQAGFGKYGMLQPHPGTRPIPRLEVTVKQASINGYDFLITRRPSASISLAGTLYDQSGAPRECRVEGSYAEFSRFAFNPDLDNAIEKATELAAKELVRCLRLVQPQEALTRKAGKV